MFLKIYLKADYHEIRMNLKDVEKTAFCTMRVIMRFWLCHLG